MSDKRIPEEKYPHVIVITGPTASGKSALAVEVAERLGADIISADSRQIYRGMPITTAVPSADDRRRVTHHLVEFLEPEGYYSAAAFESDALRIIEESRRQGRDYVVVCGGSMMYVDALLYGLDPLPTISDEVRSRVKEIFEMNGLEGTVAILDNLDPEASRTVDMQNPKRVMHALELCLQSGRPVSQLYENKGDAKRPFSYVKYVLEPRREQMFERINSRVDEMVRRGMEDEARKFYPLRHLNSVNTIGFKEWFAHFDGTMDRPTAIARIAKNTRVYAKKQLTWLKRRSDNTYLEPETALEIILRETTG